MIWDVITGKGYRPRLDDPPIVDIQKQERAIQRRTHVMNACQNLSGVNISINNQSDLEGHPTLHICIQGREHSIICIFTYNTEEIMISPGISAEEQLFLTKNGFTYNYNPFIILSWMSVEKLITFINLSAQMYIGG
jgi:hypothetical protein